MAIITCLIHFLQVLMHDILQRFYVNTDGIGQEIKIGAQHSKENKLTSSN